MKLFKPTKTLLVLSFVMICSAVNPCIAQKDAKLWTDTFDVDKCKFSSIGENKYFILKPNYNLMFEKIEHSDTVSLSITVLNETKIIAGIETRIVEEKEFINGKIIEISRNYFAICTQTNSVFYFGEDVDIYKDGKVVNHDGSWIANTNNAKAGIMMPGNIFLGSRFYQEIAPKIAMDRAEIVSTNETLMTPAGIFTNCLKIEETTPLEPKAKDYKIYAPGIGLVKDGNLLLTKYSFK